MTTPLLKILERGVLSHNADHGAYMPSITQLADGRWIACQHIGSGLATPDNRIEVLQSDDGKNWESLGCPHSIDPNWSYRGPDIQQLSDGRFILTATRFENSGGMLFDPDSEALQRPEMLQFFSDDHGVTWTAPQIVPVDIPPERYTWNKSGRLMMLSESRWLYPFETWKPEEYTGPPDQKAAAVISTDQGKTWGDMTVIADDPEGKLLWWDQMNTRLADGRLYVMLWTHCYGTKNDLNVHWVVSEDEGRTWSQPQPTNLPGQVCCPIPLPSGGVAAVYNHRSDPQGVRVAVSQDLATFDRDNEVIVFDAGAEATLGETDHENFFAEHLLIAFGKPQGNWISADGSLLTYFWCTVNGITHTRWVKLGLASPT